jgi:tetratricopeptide (TPR) repeat protein
MFFRHLSQFREAEAFLEENRYEEAEKALSQVLEKTPDTFEALLYRALTRLYLGRLKDAHHDAQRAVEIRPNNGVGLMIRGEIELEQAAPAKAYESFRACVLIEKDNGRALFGLAKSAAQLGKKFEAAEAMEQALQFEKDFVMAQCFTKLFEAK